MLRKNINIHPELEEFIRENHLNLSRYIQAKLGELIKEHTSRSESMIPVTSYRLLIMLKTFKW